MRNPLLAITALCLTTSGVNAVGFKTQFNCASDYYSYCSQHSIGSPGLRKCMRANGPRLSKACINALIEDGEVSRAEVEQEKAKLLAAKSKAKPNPKPGEPKIIEAAQVKRPDTAAKAKVVAKKAAPATQPKVDTVAVSTPQKPAATKPLMARAAIPVSPPAAAAPAIRHAVALDQSTFEALKKRGDYFIAEEAMPPQSTVPQSTDTPEAVASNSGTEFEESAANPVSLAQEDPATAGEDLTETGTHWTTIVKSEPRQRTEPYPEGRMSLGRNLAQEPPTWWDKLVQAVLGE